MPSKTQPIIDAPLSKLLRLQQLQRAVDAAEARRMARQDVFALLGFSPNCAVQHAAVRSQLADAGVGEDTVDAETLAMVRNPAAAADADVTVPARCGRCPQEQFVDLPDENLDVLYGGAGGGGKSHSLLMLALRACVKYPGIQVFWFRRSFPELNQSVLRLLARFGHARALGGRWDGSKYELRFPGGSVLTFGHAKNLQEASALSSAEINLLILDERTTIPPEVVNFLYTRVRSGMAGVPCLGIRSASNPGYVGHKVVKNGYVDATEDGRLELVDKAGRRRIFIPAKVTDNPWVGDYADTLAGIDDPDLRRRILHGDWSVMPDGAFQDWRRELIIVPPFELPASWPRYGGLDYGWTAPSAYLLAARDGDGRVWVCRELTMRQTPEATQAARILGVEDVQPLTRAADPAMWGRTGSAQPPATQLALAGCPLRKADNDRFGGKQRVHTYLALGPACSYHREQGLDLCPMLHVLDQAAPELVATMESLPRDPLRPEDVDTTADDHHYDALRYLLMSIGVAPSMVFDDDAGQDGALMVQRGTAAFDRADLSIPAAGGPEVAGHGDATIDWSQV